MRDLFVELPPGSRPRLAIERALREAIRSGRLTAGAELPSSRALAADLGIARSTVVAAYEHLAVEGYLSARQGRSTVVAAVATPVARRPDEPAPWPTFAHNFLPGEPASGSFPRRDWQRSVRRVLHDAPDGVFGYGDPRGSIELRTVVAEYLARARAVHAEPAATRIYSGFSSSLGFIAEMLRSRGAQRIAVERPMLWFHRQILELVGLEVVPIEIDDEGMSLTALSRAAARAEVAAVLVTPGNQQPLGITMSSARRVALLGWAQRTDTWIIEDDYDGEFRYDRRPIGAMQGLDPERVMYAGTASKALGPGLHLSWLVVPPALRQDLEAVTHMRAGVATIGQLALADFIERGAYDKHVQRRRRAYRGRRTDMFDRLRSIGWLRARSSDAGMQLIADIVDPSVDERSVIEFAHAASIGLVGLQTHFGHPEPALVINVCRPPDHGFGAAADALLRLLASVAGSSLPSR